MSNHNQKLGAKGETLSRTYLVSNGFTILDSNYRTRFCEIDIIAKINKTLCFIEVKTRKNTHKGLAKEAVTPAKQKKIILGAQFYLKANQLHDQPIRFDVMEVYMDSIHDASARIHHIENAFWASER